MTFAGVTPTEVHQTAAFATGSAADVLITGMTLTPVPIGGTAGTFLMWAKSITERSTNGAHWFLTLYVGGVKVDESEGSRGGGTAQVVQTLPLLRRFVVLPGQAIEVRIRNDGGGGTVTARDRTLAVLRVNN